MRRSALLVLPWLLLSAVPARSADDEAKKESRSLLRQGNQCLDKGDYEHAIEKFTQAYQRFPSPKILFSQGQALVGLNRPMEARRALQRFVAEATDVSPAHQAEARRLIAELEAKLGRIEVGSNREGALVLVDQVEEGKTPLPGPVFAEPGPHTLTVQWQGEEKTLGIAVVAGALLSNQVSFDLKPAKVSVRSNRDGARVWVDGKDVGLVPLETSLSIPPGEHDLVLQYKNEKLASHLALAEGEDKVVTLEFSEVEAPLAATLVEPPSPSTRARTEWHRSPWVWGAAGAVLVGVATTLVVVYGRSTTYPSTNMGTHPIGD